MTKKPLKPTPSKMSLRDQIKDLELRIATYEMRLTRAVGASEELQKKIDRQATSIHRYRRLNEAVHKLAVRGVDEQPSHLGYIAIATLIDYSGVRKSEDA